LLIGGLYGLMNNLADTERVRQDHDIAVRAADRAECVGRNARLPLSSLGPDPGIALS
jgi:hypothetical protein